MNVFYIPGKFISFYFFISISCGVLLKISVPNFQYPFSLVQILFLFN